MKDVRDPLFRSIRQRLAEGVDPGLFERFAIELVLPDFPTAVLVAGGSDGGVDGWVHSPENPPIPIVTTTAQNVLRNLKRNLPACKKKWPEHADTVILVTSTSLTATRQRNLAERAREMDFRLVLFEQAAVIAGLYRMPKWRVELLGIPGDPPALSQIPSGRTLALDIEPVGREQDLLWLENTRGDRILTGQPGSGKTYLLARFGRAADGFFVTSDDPAKIADAVRELEPKAVIVDDAHAYPALLRTVRQTREQIGADFEIIACAWSGFEEPAIEELGVTRQNIRELSLLTREEIAEVVRRVGVQGPDRLIAYLLDQASGRVGLAVSLTMRLLAGDWEDVVTGESLVRYVTTSLQEHVKTPLLPVLGVVSLGGASGVAMEEVAASLDHSLAELQETAARIGSTGFVAVSRGSARAVRVEPKVLREAAVRRAFFESPVPLPIEPFLGVARNPCEAASTLVGARTQSSAVPTHLVKLLLGRCPGERAWVRFAALGEDEASWVLHLRPDLVLKEPSPFLALLPGPAIERFLDSALGDARPLNSTPEHGIRRIQDWLKAGPPARGTVGRRTTVVETALRWGKGESSRTTVAERAAIAALNPKFENTSLDPISEQKMTHRWGLLPLSDLEEIGSLWPAVLAFLRSEGIADWNDVLEHLHRWIFLGGGQGAPPETYQAMRPFIQRMIDDVVELAGGHPAVLRAITEMASVRDFKTPRIEDNLFMTLFPLEQRPGSEEEQRQHREAVARLASDWSTRDPAQAVVRLEACVSESRLLEWVYPGYLDWFCWQLARKTDNPFGWLEQIAKSKLPADVLRPFLHEAYRRDPSRWLDVSEELLPQTPWSVIVAEVAVTCDGVPLSFLRKAVPALAASAHTLEILCLRGEVPPKNLNFLLLWEDPETAGFAAVGEWLSKPPRIVRPEVLEA